MQQVSAFRKPSDGEQADKGGRIFGIDSGLIGIAPENARLGGLVCEYDTKFCLIVREVERIFETEKEMEKQTFEIIGDVLGLNLELSGAKIG
jgi:hypothetical protein